MVTIWGRTRRRFGVGLISVAMALTGSGLGSAHADDATPSLPVFIPHPSDWQPNFTVFPFDWWQNRVTPEQITAQREACQWFNAQYDVLMNQIIGFQRYLHDRHDVWSTPGVQAAADVIIANIDQSAAFLDPRAHTLYIVNWPDQDEYSPLYNGDSIFHMWFQLTQISDKMKNRLPSGVINANIATINVYGNVIRDSGVCLGA